MSGWELFLIIALAIFFAPAIGLVLLCFGMMVAVIVASIAGAIAGLLKRRW